MSETKNCEEEEEKWEYLIREMVEDDLQEVEQVHIVLFPIRYSFNTFLEFISAAYLSLVLVAQRKKRKKNNTTDKTNNYSIKLDNKTYEEEEEKNECEYERKIIGVSTANRMWISPFSRERAGYLATFGILPGYRRKKLGTFLLDVTTQCLFKYFDCKYIDLHMQRANQAAHDFYIRNGYHVEKILYNFYSFNNAKHDALFMRKSLNHFSLQSIPEDFKVSDKVEYYMNHVQYVSWFNRFCLDP